MPDSKITALTSISTSTDPANDPLVIVDLSDTSMAATGTTKKVTLNQLLGASGTATLASATITGDLTVDTNVLKVNTTTNRVGINTTTPSQNLEITGSGNPLAADGCSAVRLNNTVSGRPAVVGVDDSQNFVIWNVGTEVSETIKFLTGGGNGKEQYRITHGGLFNWYDGAGGTRMTLNATGLGVGASPGYKLHVGGYSSANIAPDAALVRSSSGTTIQSGPNLLFSDGTSVNNVVLQNTQGRFGIWNYGAGVWNERLSVDANGNCGIGVTPSAWGTGYTALQNRQTCWFATSSRDLNLGANVYVDAVGYKYIATAAASNYVQFQGAHSWYTAASGTAGNAITFTQAMTLDASGALLVGTTAAPNVGAATTSSGFSINGSGNNAYIASKIDNGTCGYFRRDGTDGAALNFYKANSAVGNISVTASACTFNSTSDYRLKESVQPLVGGLARVSALKPSIYKWKADGSSGEGFLAHELAEVVPAAVSGEKDAVNEDGSIKPQGVDMSRVVPILVAAIQELTARVQTLETR